MLISTIIFFIAVFILLLIWISIGTRIVGASEFLCAVLMLAFGVVSPYLLAILTSSLFDRFHYKWFHFVGLFILIVTMNNGNAMGQTSKQAKTASTFLFVGVLISSVLMFWIAI